MELIAIDTSVWVLLCIVVAAALYSSVGQGGASGYLAVMALFGVDSELMKPAALMMNVAVTAVVLWRLQGRVALDRTLFKYLALASIPAAFLGGALQLDSGTYRMVVGVVLCLAAVRLIGWRPEVERACRPRRRYASLAGAATGFLGGLTGIGGGVLLSPLLLLMQWATSRETLVLSAGFIFVNSIAGIAGFVATAPNWPSGVIPMIGAALLGTLAGSEIAVRVATPWVMTRLLGAILLVAALRLFLPQHL